MGDDSLKIKIERQNTKLHNILKSKLTWTISGIVILTFCFAFAIGKNSAQVPLNEKKLNYDELLSQIDTKEKELKDKEDKVEEKRQELMDVIEETTQKESIISEAEEFEVNKTKLEEELNSLSDQINTKKKDLEALNTGIKTKESELASVTGQVKEKEESPKQLSAGKFIVGTDIPADRYKVTPVGKGSNFAVYDSSGEILEHTIISSTPDHGVPEFIVYLQDGYILDNSAPFKFTPIE